MSFLPPARTRASSGIGLWISLHTVQPGGVNLLVGCDQKSQWWDASGAQLFVCLKKTRLCETAAAGGCHRGTPDGPYVRSHGLHPFRGHSPHPLQPYLEARTLIYDNELFPWRFPHAQATIVCCSCGVFRCVNVSPSTPLRGSLDLLQAARAPLRSRLQQEVQRVVV